MKKLYIISLLTILALPAFADDATNPFTNATTVDEAWNIFETKSQDILNAYESKLQKREFKKLKDLRDELLKGKPSADKKDKASKDDKKQEKQKGKVKKELTEEEKEKKLNELRDNAKAMKEKEQSTENKLLGAAGIGATGIGGMQLASGLAEKNADEDAEMTMKAYLATFTCRYGEKRVAGGEVDIELPGGNELVSLYSEYVTLANDLKVRKQALGVKPGIESEAILDGATTGLYDDVGTGKTSGTYASLARALQDPNGEDAKLWAAQKQEAADKIKKGAITAGVGAVGSLVANLAINAKAPKEKSAEIKRKYSKLEDSFKEIEKEIEKLPDPTCTDSGADGGTYPNCTCATANSYWDANQGTCITCESNQEVQDDKCVPKTCNLTGLVQENACACIDTAEESNTECKCKLTGAVNKNTCACDANATQTGNKCECNSNFDEKTENGVTTCVAKAIIQSEEIATISLAADTFFDSNKYDISDAKKQALVGQIWTAIEEQQPNATEEILKETCITLTGHADYTGNDKINNPLSENRAKAVRDVLIEQSKGTLTNDNFITTGQGSTQCDKNKYNTKAKRAECRKVDVKIMTGACDGSSNLTDSTTLESLGTTVGNISGEGGASNIINQITGGQQ